MKRPTSRNWPLTVRGGGALLVAIVSFVAARELGIVELMYIGCLLLALLVAGFALLHIGRRVGQAERTLRPDVVPVGSETRVHARVSMRSVSPFGAIRWSDHLPEALEGDARGDASVLATRSAGPDQPLDIAYSARAVRRGVWSIGPLTLRTTDPFGLVRRTHTPAGDTRIVAVPATIPLPHVAISAGEAGGALHASSDQLGQGADNLIARPYVPGDSMRRIHWRATAHRDTLMVRQEEQESTHAATVLLDLGAPRWDASARDGTGQDPAFESALSTCVSIVLRLARDGYQVGVIDTDGTPICEPLPGIDAPEDVEQMLLRFASLTSRRHDTLPGLAQRYAGAQAGPIVLITGILRLQDADALAPLAHHSSLPILLVATPSAEALERATQAGWRTAAIGPEVDLAGVWSEVADRGAHHAEASSHVYA
ncbi:DUF58 domain-containing protein [Microbacterium sp. BR1]|uniref:DUF58 domain-containing protein n=1 Tax=Microbacterium sp. BR1 TaxID=1070896 RepID=UPI000C2BE277|nr:DUF58 domain-containing protein [Microbacterium sp. BR1]